MARPRPEPVQVVKQRRDAALTALVEQVPYARFLGIGFDRRGDELTAIMRFSNDLIGNPLLPALHGGATAAFLEVTAMIELSWASLWADLESGEIDPADLTPQTMPRMPKTIDFTPTEGGGKGDQFFGIGDQLAVLAVVGQTSRSM